MKYFLLGLKWLFVRPCIHLNLWVSLKVHAVLPTLCHTSSRVMLNLSQKNLEFFTLSNIFTKSINRVAINTVSLHLLDQILGKKYIKIPHPYGGYIHQQQIFQQKSCPLMIQALDSDFWTSHGTQLQEGNGSCIVSCFDDDDDDDVKAEMIPVIKGATGTISISVRKCLSNIMGDRGGTVVKVLCYKSEGRWFDSRWCHWNFSLT